MNKQTKELLIMPYFRDKDGVRIAFVPKCCKIEKTIISMIGIAIKDAYLSILAYCERGDERKNPAYKTITGLSWRDFAKKHYAVSVNIQSDMFVCEKYIMLKDNSYVPCGDCEPVVLSNPSDEELGAVVVSLFDTFN